MLWGVVSRHSFGYVAVQVGWYLIDWLATVPNVILFIELVPLLQTTADQSRSICLRCAGVRFDRKRNEMCGSYAEM